MDEYATQTVEYVRRAVGLTLEYDSDTLPVLDHYLQSVPRDQVEPAALVAQVAGAYFGEVVRLRLGGSWDLSAGDPGEWRLVLPGGLSFVPAGVVLSGLLRDAGADPGLDAPPKLRPHVESALASMAGVSEEAYFTLGFRFDTLEHLQSVLLAVAAKKAEEREQDIN